MRHWIGVLFLMIGIHGSAWAAEGDRPIDQISSGSGVQARSPFPLIRGKWHVIRENGLTQEGFGALPEAEAACGIMTPPGGVSADRVEPHWDLSVHSKRVGVGRFVSFLMRDSRGREVQILCGKGFKPETGMFIAMPNVRELRRILDSRFKLTLRF